MLPPYRLKTPSSFTRTPPPTEVMLSLMVPPYILNVPQTVRVSDVPLHTYTPFMSILSPCPVMMPPYMLNVPPSTFTPPPVLFSRVILPGFSAQSQSVNFPAFPLTAGTVMTAPLPVIVMLLPFRQSTVPSAGSQV